MPAEEAEPEQGRGWAEGHSRSTRGDTGLGCGYAFVIRDQRPSTYRTWPSPSTSVTENG
jgi:hypothetical protein